MDWDRLEELFLAAVELPPAERAAYLQATEPAAAVRAEVLSMLGAHEGDGLAIEARLLAEAGSLTGGHCGPYRLERLLGQGGMGEVYLARRDDDLYEREVAVKIVQHGPRQSLRARFARERSILARLNHPHIATLYDGGFAADGRPYLVMEYVDGLPVTAYCDDGRLGLRARLDLFIRICEAVQFAHGALVVHRDLKASNILIDRSGDPKLLDFGIAKLLAEDESAATLVLDRVLTPEHAAPEQIRGEEPTTATDVYGLGVLLCELLAGEPPLRFPTRSPLEIDRIAREVEATVPSRLLARAEPGAVAEVARQRGTDPRRLRAALRGDLDAICAKALRKEPEQRYAGVAELVADLRRHLHSRPVRAMRGSRVYQARKFLWRHFASLALSALAFVVLGGFLVVTLRQAEQVRIQRDLALAESERAEIVLDRLVDLFASAGSQATGEGGTLEMDAFLQRGEETAELLRGDPAARVRLSEALARIYAHRGDLVRALAVLDDAVELTDDVFVRLRLEHLIARLRNRHEGPEVGVPLLRASLARHLELLGPDHPDVDRVRVALAGNLSDATEARRLLDAVLARHPARPGDAESQLRAEVLSALASLDLGEADYPSARARLEEADALLARSLLVTTAPRTTVRHNLASVYARLGQWEAAEAMQREVVNVQREVSGPDSDLTAGAIEGHAVMLANLGRHAEAAARFAAALAIYERTLAAGHWRIANCERNVGQLLALGGRFAEALPHLERAVALNTAAGRDAVYQQGQLALVRLGLGETGRALSELAEVAAQLDDPAGGYSPNYRADGQVWLGLARLEAGSTAAAAACFARALELREDLLGADHPATAEASCGLAVAESRPAGAAAARYRAWGLAHPLLLARLAAEKP